MPRSCLQRKQFCGRGLFSCFSRGDENKHLPPQSTWNAQISIVTAFRHSLFDPHPIFQVIANELIESSKSRAEKQKIDSRHYRERVKVWMNVQRAKQTYERHYWQLSIFFAPFEAAYQFRVPPPQSLFALSVARGQMRKYIWAYFNDLGNVCFVVNWRLELTWKTKDLH